MSKIMAHSTAEDGGSIPTCDEAWTVGQHPAVASGWIVRPVLFGSRVRVLPECEGGHVILKSEEDARLIAAAPELLRALAGLLKAYRSAINTIADDEFDMVAEHPASWASIATEAIAKATSARVADSPGSGPAGYEAAGEVSQKDAPQ